MSEHRTDKEFQLHLFAAVVDLTVALTGLLYADGQEAEEAAREQATLVLRRWGGEGARR